MRKALLLRNLFTRVTEEPQPEQLKWIQLFDDPSQWWDNRAITKWTNQPDFKHALTGEALWIHSSPSPHWLAVNLASLEDPAPAARPPRAAYKRAAHSPPKDASMLLARLKETSTAGDLEKGRRLHQDSIQTGTNTNMYVASALVNMYVKCGSKEEARAVFESMQRRNAVSWNTVMMGYVEQQEEEVALELLRRMKDEGCLPNERTLLAVLKACRKVVSGKLVKVRSLELGTSLLSEFTSCQPDIFVHSALIDMYSKCGSMSQAQEVFDNVSSHNVVTWTALILGYAENGEHERAFSLFSEMRSRGCTPNSLTFAAVLKACICLASKEDGPVKRLAIDQGMSVHMHVVETSREDILVSNMLVDMYAKCWSLVDARTVFDRMHFQTTVSWNTLLLAYAELSEEDLCLELFSHMKELLEPNSRTYVAVLKACSSLAVKETEDKSDNRLKSLEKDMEFYSQAAEQGYDQDFRCQHFDRRVRQVWQHGERTESL